MARSRQDRRAVRFRIRTLSEWGTRDVGRHRGRAQDRGVLDRADAAAVLERGQSVCYSVRSVGLSKSRRGGSDGRQSVFLFHGVPNGYSGGAGGFASKGVHGGPIRPCDAGGRSTLLYVPIQLPARRYKSRAGCTQHSSIEEAIDAGAESGTRSILDVMRISEEPDYAAACPLSSGYLMELFGTIQLPCGLIERMLIGGGPFWGQCRVAVVGAD